jgi:hypothetical protein
MHDALWHGSRMTSRGEERAGLIFLWIVFLSPLAGIGFAFGDVLGKIVLFALWALVLAPLAAFIIWIPVGTAVWVIRRVWRRFR